MDALRIVLIASAALLLSACGSSSSPQSLILGKWEAASAKVGGADAGPAVQNAMNAARMSAEFDKMANMTWSGQSAA